MNIRASLFIAVPSFLLLLGGCIIPVNGGSGGAGGDGNSQTTSSSSSSTGSGMGGAGGQGGQAGQGGSAGPGVGGGGGSKCVGPEDGILDKLACEALNTQQVGKVCGPNNDLAPLANGTCSHGVTIFQGGAFDVLVKCLQTIDGTTAEACNDKLVEDCVGIMYAAACPSKDAATTCEAIRDSLCAKDEPFDTQGCVIDITPLQPTVMQVIANCITDTMPPTTCQADYTACFNKALTFP